MWPEDPTKKYKVRRSSNYPEYCPLVGPFNPVNWATELGSATGVAVPQGGEAEKACLAPPPSPPSRQTAAPRFFLCLELGRAVLVKVINPARPLEPRGYQYPVPLWREDRANTEIQNIHFINEPVLRDTVSQHLILGLDTFSLLAPGRPGTKANLSLRKDRRPSAWRGAV